MGALNAIKVQPKKFPKSLFLYCDYVGQYKNVSTVYNNIGQNVRPHFYATNEMCGIYYDNPNVVQDKNYCRAVCGLLIQEEERAKAEVFVREHPIFKLRDLPETDAVSTTFPFRSQLSYIFLIGKVYPELKSFAFRNRIFNGPEDMRGIIELYHFLDIKPSIELFLPYGENLQKLQFSAQPEPLHRMVGDKKSN